MTETLLHCACGQEMRVNTRFARGVVPQDAPACKSFPLNFV